MKKTLTALILIANGAVCVRASACFDDKNLLSLQSSASQRGTLVYVWSPRMGYSVENASIASRAAATSGLDFIVVHDTRVPTEELKQASAASQASSAHIGSGFGLATPPFVSPLDTSRPLCADKLINNEALRHFPTAFVINKQGMHANPIVGAMPMDAWVSSIKQRLAPP